MERIDPFTRRRIEKFVEDFRISRGELPTLGDFAEQAIDKAVVERAVKEKILSEFYVSLTNGVVKKGYKLHQEP